MPVTSVDAHDTVYQHVWQLRGSSAPNGPQQRGLTCQLLGKQTGQTRVTDISPHLLKSPICHSFHRKLHLGNFSWPPLAWMLNKANQEKRRKLDFHSHSYYLCLRDNLQMIPLSAQSMQLPWVWSSALRQQPALSGTPQLPTSCTTWDFTRGRCKGKREWRRHISTLFSQLPVQRDHKKDCSESD